MMPAVSPLNFTFKDYNVFNSRKNCVHNRVHHGRCGFGACRIVLESYMRKKRCDRNHVIYQVTCGDTGDNYIGLTVAQGQAFLRSVKVRWQKHLSRALCENKDWTFCDFIRTMPEARYQYEVLEVVRGRKPAHQRERQYIAEYQPTLNTF